MLPCSVYRYNVPTYQFSQSIFPWGWTDVIVHYLLSFTLFFHSRQILLRRWGEPPQKKCFSQLYNSPTFTCMEKLPYCESDNIMESAMWKDTISLKLEAFVLKHTYCIMNISQNNAWYSVVQIMEVTLYCYLPSFTIEQQPILNSHNTVTKTWRAGFRIAPGHRPLSVHCFEMTAQQMSAWAAF